MTLGCVRCHDHKFDPIALTDYYGIAGMLRSSPATHKIPFGVWSTLNSTELPETPEQLAARQKLEAEHEQKLASMKGERDRLEAEKKAVSEQLRSLSRPRKLRPMLPPVRRHQSAVQQHRRPKKSLKLPRTKTPSPRDATSWLSRSGNLVRRFSMPSSFVRRYRRRLRCVTASSRPTCRSTFAAIPTHRGLSCRADHSSCIVGKTP